MYKQHSLAWGRIYDHTTLFWVIPQLSPGPIYINFLYIKFWKYFNCDLKEFCHQKVKSVCRNVHSDFMFIKFVSWVSLVSLEVKDFSGVAFIFNAQNKFSKLFLIRNPNNNFPFVNTTFHCSILYVESYATINCPAINNVIRQIRLGFNNLKHHNSYYTSILES